MYLYSLICFKVFTSFVVNIHLRLQNTIFCLLIPFVPSISLVGSGVLVKWGCWTLYKILWLRGVLVNGNELINF